MSLRTADYDYQLPDELIARYPAFRRDQSRMMLLDREKQQITHLRFGDFVDLVQPRELVVLNDTKVIPARIRLPDRNAEILLLDEVDMFTWRCLVRPGKSFALGRTFSIEGQVATVIQILDEGDRLIRF
ncbi:MAG TPA: S-adenosylmethionine:tRNA ribosyltransferase-isomerase, partial [Nitrospiraceae bacterium]|nr:S-adenosylmethionine:tRNA ribosyltransferase-isomerase [Nitrospiraceae bacterium]